MRSLFASVVCVLISQAIAIGAGHCNPKVEQCHAHSFVSAIVADLKQQLREAQMLAADSNCTICYSNPCRNNGTCIPTAIDRYRCECPDDTGGPNCGTIISCRPGTCGANADCYVANHQVNCVCKQGYSGNPYVSCTSRTRQACTSGDPHYITFDGLYYDYQGTCPYVFSKPCNDTLVGYANYLVLAKNVLIGGGNSHVSRIAEVEVTFYDQVVHVTDDMRIFVNGVLTRTPYYSPSRTNARVQIQQQNSKIRILNDQLVEVTFENSRVCITVPDVPAFRGNDTLCGLAGNLDGSCRNDMLLSNGTNIYSPQNPQSCSQNGQPITEVFGDSWMTDFIYLNPDPSECLSGQIVTNTSFNCNRTEAQIACQPILDAKDGNGVFGQCQSLGSDDNGTLLDSVYNDCVFDVCQGYDRCNIFTAFVHTCQAAVPGSSYTGWRPTLDCPFECGLQSAYVECASNCPATCADPDYNMDCGFGCSEGCVCDDGFVIDNTAPGNPKPCIPLSMCGCADSFGNYHPPNQPWISMNCTLYSECVDGVYHYNRMSCSPDAFCGVLDGMQICLCKPGYTGNGTYCEDINECLDPSVCGADVGHGTCTNLPGSFNCTCNQFWSGSNCENFAPRRHCADLYKYDQDTTDGVKTINPPYSVNGQDAYSSISVYCDQTTDGGGWTLMGAAKDNINAEKTFAQYVAGFGDVANMDYWMGLSLINGMTNEANTSLRLQLHRCGKNGRPPLNNYCTYDSFKVLDANSTYAVVIPEECYGDEPQFFDGWVRWSTEIGPEFLAFDTDTSTYNCTKAYLNTGWWYDTENLCGSANLNGNRYNCSNPPTIDELNSYLEWSGNPLNNVEMWLRPFGYPDYP